MASSGANAVPTPPLLLLSPAANARRSLATVLDPRYEWYLATPSGRHW